LPDSIFLAVWQNGQDGHVTICLPGGDDRYEVLMPLIAFFVPLANPRYSPCLVRLSKLTPTKSAHSAI
jgi:hypothetical protein